MRFINGIKAAAAAFKDPTLVVDALELRKILLELHVEDDGAVLRCGVCDRTPRAFIYMIPAHNQERLKSCVQS